MAGRRRKKPVTEQVLVEVFRMRHRGDSWPLVNEYMRAEGYEFTNLEHALRSAWTGSSKIENVYYNLEAWMLANDITRSILCDRLEMAGETLRKRLCGVTAFRPMDIMVLLEMTGMPEWQLLARSDMDYIGEVAE